ncbi:MAG: (2Fe-2S)-binding protein [Desulfarculaceae bacterium]|jgi:aerobic-type carbon monoxide dehydrogenase small subunit (CoxS/CutS family)
MKVEITVNNQAHRLDVDPDTPLLWVIRDHLGLTGTKYSCGIGECGACTVLLDGQAAPSCAITIEEADGASITTIEGLNGPAGNALIKAWTSEDVPQCGYCQPGQLMTAAALLGESPHPTDEEINQAMSGVLCRCGTYQRIRSAIHRAAREVKRA